MSLLAVVVGLVLLAVGGELVVRGASRLAVSVGIRPVVVGLTVVAFGTSLVPRISPGPWASASWSSD